MEEVLMEQAVEETAEEMPEARDFAWEVQELYESRPELRGSELPEEVVQACIGGQTLQAAYSSYAARQRQEAEALRKENRILRQNEKAAAKAPIRGISRGGSVPAKPEDAFLKGFQAEW